MWKRFADLVRCPICKYSLELRVFEETTESIDDEYFRVAESKEISLNEFDVNIETGILTCTYCKVYYPIVLGVPLLITYPTPMSEQFRKNFQRELSIANSNMKLLSETPPAGEEFAMNSFSKEWLDYKYDGVIWEWDYKDHEEMFLLEIGRPDCVKDPALFLEVGCGLGLTTSFAQKNLNVDAVGMDLSLAVIKARQHYRNNPFLHFVQGSLFHVPFENNVFDFIYSRGVLHHTFSTEEAFKKVSPLCRPSGCFYLWIYGLGSIKSNVFRRTAYAAEIFLRPLLSTSPSSIATKILLSTIAMFYIVFNRLRRFLNPHIQSLSFVRAVHAARDRFTPRFAHRHSVKEVVGWFEREGFEEVSVVDWRVVPSADQEDFKRNIGVRGYRKELV